MPPDTYRTGKLSFVDLLKVVDAVVTKPGYGIVSGCIANHTPILYTNREDFREYDVLVEGIKEYTHNSFVPREDLLNGKWPEYLDQLIATEYHWPKIAINGTETAATKILEAI